jgi:hypothetical protein
MGPLGVDAHEPTQPRPPDPQDAPRHRSRQRSAWQIRQEVPEVIGQQDFPLDPSSDLAGRRHGQAHRLAQRGAEGRQGDAPGQVRCHRCKDVPPVERPADRPAVVSQIRQDDAGRPRKAEAESQEPVVGPDEVVTAGLHRDCPANAADPGIHDREMHGAAREEAPRGLEEQGRAADVLRRHCVGQIDEPDPGMDREDDALDDTSVGVLEPEVGEQSDHAARAGPPASSHRSRWITYSAIRPKSWRASELGTRSSAATPAAA